MRVKTLSTLPPTEIIALFRNSYPARFGRLDARTDTRFKTILAPNITYGDPKEKTFTARTDFVPVDLDNIGKQTTLDIKPEYFEDRQALALSEQYQRVVVKDARGIFGFINEQCFFVLLNS